MKYYKQLKLKNGKELILRNGTAEDGAEVVDVFNRTHGETDFLYAYPDENSFDAKSEGSFLDWHVDKEKAVMMLAVVDGRIVGTASVETMGEKYKVRHRAEFGISILKEYWGLGIGGELLAACIECARNAGYEQLELTVVGENERAIALYRKYGFTEFGRNPFGYKSRSGGYQETVFMRLGL